MTNAIAVREKKRCGGALVEGAITTMVLMTLLLGTVDMGVAVFHMHIVSEAARQGARKAIVHGSTPGNLLGQWGPASFSGTGTSSDPKVTEISPYLTGLDLSKVTIDITWPDASSAVEKRVTYKVTTTWKPVIAWIFGSSIRTMSGTSTMPIAH